MKKILYLLGALVAVVALLLVLALVLVDAQAITRPLAARASQALGQPVELGEIDLDLFPLPAARVRSVRVGTEPPLAEIEEVRLRVSLLALLVGRVALRALEVDAPHIRLEVDEDGRPVLPGAAPRAPAPDRGGRPEPDRDAESDGGPALAITGLRITDGVLEVGPWRAERIAVAGDLGLDRTARLDVEADLPGLAALRDGAVEVAGLGGDALRWRASGELRDVELGAAAEILALDARVAGRAEVRFEAASQNGVIDSGSLELRLRALEVRAPSLELAGDVDASAALGGELRIDLTGAVVSDGATLRKPAGAPLVLAGPLASRLEPGALSAATLTLGPSAVALELALDEPRRVRLGPGAVDLAPLAGWWLVDTHPTEGAVELADLAFAPEPLAVTGRAELRDVRVPLQHGTVSVSGPLRGTGATLRGDDLRVVVGGQTAVVDAGYDLASGRVEVSGETQAADLEALLTALAGRALASGTLRADVALSGPPALESLTGSASFEVAPGRIRGLSLMRGVLGELSAIPLLVARVKGRDLSRYEEEEFQRLTGRARLAGGQVRVDALDLEYRHSRGSLRGVVSLPEGALELEGEVVVSREADADLAGSDSGARERVIPICVGGTIDDPKVRLCRNATAVLIEAYAGGGRLREKLEEQLGTGGAEAVQDLLEGILGGKREK